MIATIATLAGFPAARRCWYFALRVWVAAHGDQRWHIEGIAQGLSAAADERFALPLSGLACEGGEPYQAGHLFAIKRAKFRHQGQHRGGGDSTDTG